MLVTKKPHLHLCKLIYVQGKLKSNSFVESQHAHSAFFFTKRLRRFQPIKIHVIMNSDVSLSCVCLFNTYIGHAQQPQTSNILQVVILLYVCHWMIHFIWRLGDDPDNVAIPYLTAIGDLLGTAFLAVAFHLLYLVGDKDADLGDQICAGVLPCRKEDSSVDREITLNFY